MMHLQCVKIGVDYQENYYTTSFVYKNGAKLNIELNRYAVDSIAFYSSFNQGPLL